MQVYPAYNEHGNCPGDCPLERSTPPVPQVSHLYPSPSSPTAANGPGKLNPDLINKVAAGIKLQSVRCSTYTPQYVIIYFSKLHLFVFLAFTLCSSCYRNRVSTI